MSKSINIAIVVIAVLAGLISTSPLASGSIVEARISDLSGLCYLLFAIPVVLLVTSISALYGKSVQEHWWHMGAGLIGLMLALMSTFAARTLLTRMGDSEQINFVGYALPFLYGAILFLATCQGARVWALRLNADARKKYDAAIGVLIDTPSPIDPAALNPYLETFVGGTQYRDRWARLLSFSYGEQARFQLHPFALILGSPWWFYRKMYRLVTVFLIAELIVGMVIGIIFSFSFTSDGDIDAIIYVYLLVSILIVNFPTSLIADRIYLDRALTAVGQIRKSSKEEEAMNYALHIKGGVARIAAVLAGLTTFGLVWITAWHWG
jgi:hypothetical protein